MLESLGVDAVAESVYRTMLAHPEWAERDVVTQLALSAGEVRRARGRLVEAGLLRRSFEDPELLRAVGPEVGLTELIARHEADVSSDQRRLDEGRATMARLVAEYVALRRSPGDTDVEYIDGVDAVNVRIETMLAGVRSEVRMLALRSPMTRMTVDYSRMLDERCRRRGVTIRKVYPSELVRGADNQAFAEYLRWQQATGVRVREAEQVPLRMILLDQRDAFLHASPEGASAEVVLVRGAATLVALAALFEQVWDGARRIAGSSPAASRAPSEIERELLRLLAGGLTDEAVARKLGVSLRTVRRMMADLMGRLDSASRFQAGMRAAAMGWL